MNKIIVSIVLAVILVLVINKITDVIYYVEKPEKSAYQVTVTTTASTTTTEKNSEDIDPGNIMTLFASTSVDDGAKVLKNVRLATASLKAAVIRLVQLYGVCLEERLVLFLIINILKL